jgi:phosphate starvation-inducible PhoH-like protein
MARANRPKKPVEREFVPVEGKTLNQKLYIEDILDHYYTLCVGPAGSGKTHIASGIGAELLVKEKTIDKLIVTRPIIAAEDIGYLPGDGADKIHPYLIPIFEELGYFLNVENYMKQKQVFIEPIAFLRGRTIKNAMIIVDEAQNCTYSQLKMVLTRMGEGSKVVINGDLDQSDLPQNKQGGLAQCIEKLSKVKEPGVVAVRAMGKQDIVRHPAVHIILKYLEEVDNA